MSPRREVRDCSELSQLLFLPCFLSLFFSFSSSSSCTPSITSFFHSSTVLIGSQGTQDACAAPPSGPSFRSVIPTKGWPLFSGCRRRHRSVKREWTPSTG
ncbi:Uncharacterized protein APZ42_011658 [Daphnia magna]|uniref:Secreted protein n=1 Tax=Daphnia magna TaxID=35525 RepID=A0A162SVW3_9CRUS|nr:Uncharacterized protein APZ42_011658 [Daphnia magna]